MLLDREAHNEREDRVKGDYNDSDGFPIDEVQTSDRDDVDFDDALNDGRLDECLVRQARRA